MQSRRNRDRVSLAETHPEGFIYAVGMLIRAGSEVEASRLSPLFSALYERHISRNITSESAVALYRAMNMRAAVTAINMQQKKSGAEPMRPDILMKRALEIAIAELEKTAASAAAQNLKKIKVLPKEAVSHAVPMHLQAANRLAWNKSAFFTLMSVTPDTMQPLKGLERLVPKTLHSSLKQ